LGEFLETALTEANLFVFGSAFPFRKLAVEEMRKYSKRFMADGAAQLAHGVSLDSFTTYGKAGIRAQLLDLKNRALVMDFLVEGDKHSTHVLNAVSPAWTCSQPFAHHVVNSVMKL
jgi:L-2-hydroxyglutarate oxidase LhgO